MPQPVLLLDVIETLFSLSPLTGRLRAFGLTERDGDLFFAQLLRDAFALSATGKFRPFPEIARGSATVFLESAGIEASEDTLDQMLSAFSELPAHPDVEPGLRHAQQEGAMVVLLTNGTRNNTEQLVRNANLQSLVDRIVSVEDLKVWKPLPSLYRGACQSLGALPAHATLIAAHAWDVHGALEAGLKGVWIERRDHRYHPLMGKPLGYAKTLTQAVKMALDQG